MTEQPLPEAEMEILTCLQRGGPQTARVIREAIAPFRPMAHGSVLTLLGRLERKGLVTRRKAAEGKSYIYRAARTATGARHAMMGKFLDRLFGGDGVALVSSLFETRPPSPEELDRLQRLVDDLRLQDRKGSRS